MSMGTAHKGSDRAQMSSMEHSHGAGALARRFPMASRVREDASATPETVFALVYRQMRTLAGHRDIDELVQIAAEQALRALPSFAGRSKLSTWTFRICYLTVRKHDRWYHRWLRRFTLTDDGELPEPTADLPRGDERMELNERADRLRAALDALSQNRRDVVMLHDLEGLSVDEIADIVSARPRAVRSRLRDGRAALTRLLASDPYFGDDACLGKDQR
jgi:RNA polymerase sigma factor (sigma-70 family)